MEEFETIIYRQDLVDHIEIGRLLLRAVFFDKELRKKVKNKLEYYIYEFEKVNKFNI